MTSHARRPDAALLLAHAGRLRALALRIVEDAAEADDVLQGTFVAALARPPRAGTPLGAWLSRVARNLSLDRVRRRRARERHEAAAAPPPPAATPDEMAARAETFGELVGAVTALEPIYRDVVVLRFFDELETAEVAARLGVPVETARTRLKRALAMLRDRLDRRYGSRSAWAVALVGEPWVRPATRGTASGAGGALVVAKLAAAAAVMATIALGVEWFVGREAPDRTTELANGRSGGARIATDDAGHATGRRRTRAAAAAASAEVEATIAGPAAPEATIATPVPAAPGGVLEVVAVTESGSPVEGLRVGISWPGGPTLQPHRSGPTDARGVWRCPRPPVEATVSADVEKAVSGRWFLECARTVLPSDAEVRLVLEEAGLVRGRVVDSAGDALELLELEVHVGGRRVFQTNSEARGEFIARAPLARAADLVLTGVVYRREGGAAEPAPSKVWAVQSGSGSNWEGRLTGVTGSTCDVVIVARQVPWDAEIVVLVTDPGGEPLAGAHVAAAHGVNPSRFFRAIGADTGHTGCVRIGDLDRRHVRIEASLQGGAHAGRDWLPPLPVDVAPRGQEITLAFRAAVPVAGTVGMQGADSRWAGHCQVRVFASDARAGATPLGEGATDESGAFRVLIPAEAPQSLRVEVETDVARGAVDHVAPGRKDLRVVLGTGAMR